MVKAAAAAAAGRPWKQFLKPLLLNYKDLQLELQPRWGSRPVEEKKKHKKGEKEGELGGGGD